MVERLLEGTQRLGEHAERFVELHDLEREASAVRRARAEVDDLDRPPAADAIEASDALLDNCGIPRQIVEDKPATEFEVPPLAPGFGRDQDPRPVGLRELRHLDVALGGRQPLMEDSDSLAPAKLDLPLEHLQLSPLAGEDEGLRALPPPLA